MLLQSRGDEALLTQEVNQEYVGVLCCARKTEATIKARVKHRKRHSNSALRLKMNLGYVYCSSPHIRTSALPEKRFYFYAPLYCIFRATNSAQYIAGTYE